MKSVHARARSSSIATLIATVATLVAQPSQAGFKGLRSDTDWSPVPIDTTNLPLTYFSVSHGDVGPPSGLGLVFTPLGQSRLDLASAQAFQGLTDLGSNDPADAVTWCTGACDFANGSTSQDLAQAYFTPSTDPFLRNDEQVDLTFLCGYGFVATPVTKAGATGVALPTQNCQAGTAGEVDANFLINPVTATVDFVRESTGPGNPAAVPEPAMLGMFSLGALAVAARRGKRPRR